MTTVNLRTRGVAEAAELVDYRTFLSGTTLSINVTSTARRSRTG